MTFGGSIGTCFSKYFTFSGRASRPEYWYFFLFILLGNVVATMLDAALFDSVTTTVETSDTGASASIENTGPIAALFSLAVFLPHFAVAFRRMHDTGRSGLYALLPFLLMLGAVLVLVFGIGIASGFAAGGSLDILFTRATLLLLIPTLVVLLVSPLLVLWWLTRPSQPGTNQYGPNPYEVTQ
ncbi:DUF805 domain-containing protein [Ruegeria marina]|uniref:Uncharacterized membrane protein YhaH, DUF805 family n=1 Tax=Ruegeria marina TaxID=639004 RepID=A0A1G6MBK3_9RHOB|nr:DUF805 domain-containing protein [Ruegeria marina]SDC52811.1 Uncharacterized membrane protein YhaH, DUF805 family [Ruegeria marina]